MELKILLGDNYECICLFLTDKAPSFIASENVGWAWYVRSISSELAPNSMQLPFLLIYNKCEVIARPRDQDQENEH